MEPFRDDRFISGIAVIKMSSEISNQILEEDRFINAHMFG